MIKAQQTKTQEKVYQIMVCQRTSEKLEFKQALQYNLHKKLNEIHIRVGIYCKYNKINRDLGGGKQQMQYNYQIDHSIMYQ
eukprot:403358621